MSDPDRTLADALRAWREGDADASTQAVERLYGGLKDATRDHVARVDRERMLSPADLMQQALQLAGDDPTHFESRVQHRAGMSLVIRATLVDHARAWSAQQRDGPAALHVAVGEVHTGAPALVGNLLTIERALSTLERLDPRCGQVMHLTCFAGLSRAEIAGLLGVPQDVVERDVVFARGFIAKALRDGI